MAFNAIGFISSIYVNIYLPNLKESICCGSSSREAFGSGWVLREDASYFNRVWLQSLWYHSLSTSGQQHTIVKGASITWTAFIIGICTVKMQTRVNGDLKWVNFHSSNMTGSTVSNKTES